jgi:hypothetical protein
MGITLARLTFATAMRVIDRIHHYTANMGTLALPSGTTRFSHHDVFVIHISDLTNRCHTGRQYLAHFTGLKTNLDIGAISAHDLSRTTSTPNQLTTLAGL